MTLHRRRRRAPVVAHPEVDQLAAYRLDHDLSFEALASEMSRAGYPVTARGLAWALTKSLKTQPRATTLHKITHFLATLDGRRPARRRLA